ncbi:HAMP domain-containing protein [Bacillus lacus]|uniref:histidine kinase n=1 Tax=Metabacillus lacus TaxID=1983721 RepID=A0A7X2J1R1_9BACI|nr:HAMP domain-containing sensor histidine kinase [Metabacillus lacus]MRX73078.1 HAMP domain-containing protein [Metabacillus lacus]
MKLKRKYQLILGIVLICIPLSFIVINLAVTAIYQLIKPSEPFHESIYYVVMHVLFIISSLTIVAACSLTINSLLHKINRLKETVRELASGDTIPEKLSGNGRDEMDGLIESVNLLIERTAFRELAAEQEKKLQEEYLKKLRHDINTPLTAMQLQLFYLEYERGDLPLKSIHSQIEYIGELTRQIQLESTVSLKSSHILKDPVHINELLHKVVQKWSYLFQLNGIRISIHESSQDELILNSNNAWLHRMFDNVFQNTLRHSDAENLHIVISRSLVEIEDNGKGFQSGREKQGLGLTVIDDIATALGIPYTLSSDFNGTRFTFIFNSQDF